MGSYPQEPNADMREAALGMRGLYVALVEAGFSEGEAMHMVTEILRQMVESGLEAGEDE